MFCTGGVATAISGWSSWFYRCDQDSSCKSESFENAAGTRQIDANCASRSILLDTDWMMCEIADRHLQNRIWNLPEGHSWKLSPHLCSRLERTVQRAGEAADAVVEETEELSHRLSQLKAAIDGKLDRLRPLSIPEKPILAGHSVSSKVATPSQDAIFHNFVGPKR